VIWALDEPKAEPGPVPNWSEQQLHNRITGGNVPANTSLHPIILAFAKVKFVQEQALPPIARALVQSSSVPCIVLFA